MRRARRWARAAMRSDTIPTPIPNQVRRSGKLSEKQTITSKIYEGMKTDYWVYASPGVDPNVPAPLMVWQDGQNLINQLNAHPR